MTTKRRSKKRTKKANPAAGKTKARSKRRKKANPAAGKTKARSKRCIRKANPSHSHKRSKRRSKRNPAVPVWAMAALSAVVSLASFAALWGGSVAVTAALDPSGQTVVRNRRIAGVLVAVGGVALAAFASPLIGVGVAAAGLVAAGGFEAALTVVGLLPKPEPVAAPQLQTAPSPNVGALLRDGRQNVGAVFRGGQQTVGDLYGRHQGVSVFG